MEHSTQVARTLLGADVLAIDWHQPWYAPYATVGALVAAALGRGQGLASALHDAAEATPWPSSVRGSFAAGVRFVAADPRPGGEPYEAFIARTRQVPVRDDLHDFFNGLVWLRFPAFKLAVATLHARELASSTASGARGRLRDDLTLLDEGGAVWAAPRALVAPWDRREWRALFAADERSWDRAVPCLLGHGLLAALIRPRTAITAHVWLLPESSDAVPVSPQALQDLVQQPRRPLPVLGIPGWWPANRESGFYDDAQVFRRLRR